MTDLGSPTEPSLSPTSPWNQTVVGSDDEEPTLCPTLVPTVVPISPPPPLGEEDMAPAEEDMAPAAPPRDEEDEEMAAIDLADALLGEQMANAKRAKFRKVLEEGMADVDEKKKENEEEEVKNENENEKGEVDENEKKGEWKDKEEEEEAVAPAAAAAGSGSGAPGSSGAPPAPRRTAEEHRQQHMFVPDPRNPAEMRLRNILDKKIAEKLREGRTRWLK